MRETRITFMNRLIGVFPQADIDLIMFAYDLSKEAHRTQKRFQGGRYFDHPRAGCIILMDEFKVFDRDLLIAFLLHDVGEDTPLFGNVTFGWDSFVATARFRVTRIFNARVADILIRLTKPCVGSEFCNFKSKDAMMDYYLGELKQSDDALILKAVDRLHNLRTIPHHKEGWLAKQSRETKELLIPAFNTISSDNKTLMSQIIAKIDQELLIPQSVAA